MFGIKLTSNPSVWSTFGAYVRLVTVFRSNVGPSWTVSNALAYSCTARSYIPRRFYRISVTEKMEKPFDETDWS
jgi:hypothetical protein